MAGKHLGDQAAELIGGPIGGLAIGVLFYTIGCATVQLFCPAGERTNILGWTVMGWVGNVTEGGAAAIGVVAALVIGGLIHAFHDD
jgi:hypothetical protein